MQIGRWLYPVSYTHLKDDEADESAILEWGKYTDNDFNYRIFPGGHFYLRDCEDEDVYKRQM